MKIHTVYTCEKCGQEFTDSEQCKAHEDTHIGIKLYAEHKTNHRTSNSDYPEFVELEMTDGAICEYEITGHIVKATTQKENPLATGKED